MKLRNGKVLEIEREEAGDFYRFSASEIIEACRAWDAAGALFPTIDASTLEKHSNAKGTHL